MFTIYTDNILMYDDTSDSDALKVLSPKLSIAVNSAGTLTMTVPPGNAGYDHLERTTSLIRVYKNTQEEPYWEGRILDETTDFWNCKKITCEGVLGYLNDTIQPPNHYQNQTTTQFLTSLISVHNAKVDASKRFVVGSVTPALVMTSNHRYTNYEGTLQAISEKLIDKIGGYLKIRNVNGTRYLDYLGTYNEENSQKIEFGKNLLDFSKSFKSENYCTVLVPRGAQLEEGPYEALTPYTDVSSVNNGSIYVTLTNDDFDTPPDVLPVDAFGWIEAVKDWEDVTVPANLLRKAKDYLKSVQFDNMELSVKAIDLRYAGAQYETIDLCDTVRVVSAPHGLDKLFPVTKMEIPLDKPEDTAFTLGLSVQESLTHRTREAQKIIKNRIAEIPTAQHLTSEAKAAAATLIEQATTGYINIIQNDETGAQELVISNTPDYLHATKIWRWTMNGLGYSNQGYNSGNYELALTADGAINASMISVGDLVADIIRAGILQDQVDGQHFSLNLETGEVHIKAVADAIDDAVDEAKDYTDTEISVAAGNIESTVSQTYQTKADAATSVKNVTTKEQYYMSTSSSSATGGTWSDSTSAWSSGKYVWTRVATTKTLANGTSSTEYSTGVYDQNLTTALSAANGAVGSTSVKTQYYLSTSDASATGGSWSDSIPAWEDGKYIWTRVATTTTSVGGSSTTTYTPSSSGAYDQNLTKALADMPIVNLLPTVYYREWASGLTYSSGGITWTVNPDGSVTATGTATANSDYYLTRTSDADVPRINLDHTKKYTFSGVPLVTGCQMRVAFYNQTSTSASVTRSIETTNSYTQAAGYYFAVPYLRIVSGTALPSGGVKFYPMFEVGGTAHGYISTHGGGSTAMMTSIRQNAANITSVATRTTNIENTVSDMSVGGRNYYRAIDDAYISGGASKNNVTSTYNQYDNGAYEVVSTLASTSNAYRQIKTPLFDIPSNILGKTMLFHCESIETSNANIAPRVFVLWYKLDDSNAWTNFASAYLTTGALSKSITVPTDALKVMFMIRMHSVTTGTYQGTGEWVKARGIKLEEGTMPTTWTPAPEDVPNYVSSTAKSLINQSAEEILHSISETYVTDNDLTSILGTQVQQLNDSINSVVSRVNALNDGFEQRAQSVVNQTTSGMQLQITEVTNKAGNTENEIHTYFDFTQVGLKVKGTAGSDPNSYVLLASDKMEFYSEKSLRLWLNASGANAENFVASKTVSVGNFIWETYDNGFRLRKKG